MHLFNHRSMPPMRRTSPDETEQAAASSSTATIPLISPRRNALVHTDSRRLLLTYTETHQQSPPATPDLRPTVPVVEASCACNPSPCTIM